MSTKILITNQSKAVQAPSITEFLQKIATLALKALDLSDTELSVLLVDEEEIKALNSTYRGLNSVTDVLSFPQNDQEIIGDVVICIPQALQQAKTYQHSPQRELAYLLIHGILHLIDYDHQSEENKQKMRQKEEELLQLLNLAQGAEE